VAIISHAVSDPFITFLASFDRRGRATAREDWREAGWLTRKDDLPAAAACEPIFAPAVLVHGIVRETPCSGLSC
jgi:hypothetical protein